MSGDGFLLDTNAVIQLLKGNSDVASILGKADAIALSIVSELEFLSFAGLSERDTELYRLFRARVRVLEVPANDMLFSQMVVAARRQGGMKLPDAIIAATARANGLAILTADDHFRKLKLPWNVKFFRTI